IKGVGSEQAVATTTHKYTSGGTFEVTLRIRLKIPTYGNPLAVTHKVEVEGGGPAQFALKVTKNVSGQGTVTSSPAGSRLGRTECQANLNEGSLVKLAGAQAAGSKAVVWQSCPGTVNGSNECEVTMSSAKEAIATFDLQQHLLKVAKKGTGS